MTAFGENFRFFFVPPSKALYDSYILWLSRIDRVHTPQHVQRFLVTAHCQQKLGTFGQINDSGQCQRIYQTTHQNVHPPRSVHQTENFKFPRHGHNEKAHQRLIDSRHRRKHCRQRNVFGPILVTVKFAQIRNGGRLNAGYPEKRLILILRIFWLFSIVVIRYIR